METWPALFTRTGFVRALNRFEMGMPRRFDVEGIMTVSTPLAERFIATGYPAERVCPIQYGYDSQLFAPAAGSEALPGSDPVVLMHGSFDKHHIGPIAFGAVARIHASRPKVIFRFVGRRTETLDRFIRQLAIHCPGIRLELPGFIPYAEVARQVASATVGIVPYEESQGVHCAFVAKAVEYLGCGIPVVSTPLENLRRYFLNEPAIRFSNFDPESLAREVGVWLDTPDRERRAAGLAASQRVRKELDWRVIANCAANFVERRTQRTAA
jgi:glycosyltransferase involved in cell wall biosynthesis